MTTLESWIKMHEGYSEKPYKDTKNKLTIGWGRNLEDRGISQDEANLMLSNDIKLCLRQLSDYDWYVQAIPDVKWALIDMCFNMGLPRLLGFKKMIAALKVKDYTKAAIEALDSKWAQDVPERAKDVAMMIRGSK